MSISTDSVYAIPAEISNADETAAKLAAILALDENKLAAKLKKGRLLPGSNEKLKILLLWR